MEYMTIQEAAERWGITERRIQVLCSSGRLDGATKFGRQWAIPAGAEKPEDARIKSGKYVKKNSMDGNKAFIFTCLGIMSTRRLFNGYTLPIAFFIKL